MPGSPRAWSRTVHGSDDQTHVQHLIFPLRRLHLIPTFMWGLCTMTHASMHGRTLPTLLFDIIPHSCCPTIFSYRLSSLPSPSYFHFHRPTSYALFPSHAHTTPISFPRVSLRFPPLLFFLYHFISYNVQLHNFAHLLLHSHFCDLQFLFM